MNDFCPLVSIIVPAYNAREYLMLSLPAIKRSDYKNFELIVVDDNSSDGSGELAEKYADNVIRTAKRLAPGKARNIGASAAKGDILLFIDADVQVLPETVSLAVKSMVENRGIGAVFGSYDEEPYEKNFFSQYKNLFHHYVHQMSGDEVSTFWAGCGAIWRELFLRVGGFPEKYSTPAIEDVELGYKLSENNEKIRLVKELQVKHLKKWDLKGFLKADIFYRAVPWTKLAFKKGLPLDLNFKLSDRISGVLATVFFINFIFVFQFPSLLICSLILAIVLLYLNRGLYRFFFNKRGASFTIASVFFHWLYYFYSAAVFAGLTSFMYLREIFGGKTLEKFN